MDLKKDKSESQPGETIADRLLMLLVQNKNWKQFIQIKKWHQTAE